MEVQRKHIRVKFNEEKHLYFTEKNGHWTRVPSVTAIINLITPGYTVRRLQGWAARLAAESILEDSPETLEQDKVALERAKKAYLVEFQRTGEIGTETHKYINNFYNGLETCPASSKQVQKCIDRFDDWRARYPELEVIETEGIVAHRDEEFAGTFDLLVENKSTGLLEVIDFKTRSDIREERDTLQLSAYIKAYEDCTGEEVSRARVVRLPKVGLKLPPDYIITKEQANKYWSGVQAMRYLYWLFIEKN